MKTIIFFLNIFCYSAIFGQSTSGEVSSGQFSLRYQVDGNGPAMYCIGSTVYYPRVFSQNLKEDLQVVYIDHRGFTSPSRQLPLSSYSMDTIIHDIELVREKLGHEKIMIMGHSGHSYMALEYAKAYPERVSHVVMIGCPPKLGESNRLAVSQNWNESVDPERKKAMEAWNAQISDDELAQLSPEEAFIRSYVRNGALAWYDPYYDSTPLWEGIDINIHMFNHVWGKLFAEIDITKGLKNLNIPVLLVLGRYDYLVAPSSSWDPFRSFFKDLTIRIFEKSGHTPQFEESALFNRELLSWIQSRQK